MFVRLTGPFENLVGPFKMVVGTGGDVMTLWRWLISLFRRAPDDPASELQRRVADVVAADASRAASTLPPSP